jgi:Uma2 family endonuclease
LTEKLIQGAPALVVEILSPSTRRRDLGIKRDLYDKFGVREYWIVDSKKLTVTVYRREPPGICGLATVLKNDAESVLDTPLVPGFSLSLQRLFR